ncbi:uncharacterized protein CXorf65 homolog isoform X1 [Polypterus senegalus]|uniref:uncharacterized protein CXorf65 homolog isoform X1 n=1 Tax=Polypterus senegalus TaxID=55291 RepID=UPI0019650831|nr:uncharacterized protein CXorf65 homolog isoform X1 [Polypterus senegalus]
MESTCITIRHGENKQFYANTDCRLIVFLNFLKDKLELPRKELIDLCDESGNLMLLFLCKNQMENTKHLVPGRCTFIVCRIAICSISLSDEVLDTQYSAPVSTWTTD